MSEKGIMIVPTELVKKIDDNRGDMSQASFIEFLIDSQPKHESKDGYVSKEEFESFEQDIKELLKSFFDFSLSYGSELVLDAKYGKGGDGFRHLKIKL